jgi:hypothetical protein
MQAGPPSETPLTVIEQEKADAVANALAEAKAAELTTHGALHHDAVFGMLLVGATTLASVNHCTLYVLYCLYTLVP